MGSFQIPVLYTSITISLHHSLQIIYFFTTKIFPFMAWPDAWFLITK
jgi:hypothetical protein